MTQIVGRRLGRYEVQQEIGRGGMARVYRATDTLLQRSVAVKVLAPQLGLDPEFARRFEREAIMAANLRHPAIVTVYDVGEQDGLHYIAMEFIRGRSLHAIITEGGALGLGYAVSLLEPVARALDYAHVQGAVHRDVKPHNIMLDVEGRVLLTDFGIAQAPENEPGERLTRTGIFMGTPEYISPEQAESRRVDGRSDLYSLGIVAYEIITGRVPFSGGTPQLIVAHAQQPPPPASTVAENLPSEVDAVLARALAKSPQARFATGTALIEALRIVARRNGQALPLPAQLADLALPLKPEPDLHVVAEHASAETRNSDAPRSLAANAAPTPLAPPRLPPPANGERSVDREASASIGRRRVPWSLAAPLLAALALTLLLAFFTIRGSFAGGGTTPTSTPVASPALPTSAPPTSQPALLATTSGVTATNTPTATRAQPTATAPSPSVTVAATNTPAPPTALPAATRRPPALTTVPPTAVLPTATATPEPSLTLTADPSTLTTTATNTGDLPTDTITPTLELPTATATAEPTIVIIEQPTITLTP